MEHVNLRHGPKVGQKVMEYEVIGMIMAILWIALVVTIRKQRYQSNWNKGTATKQLQLPPGPRRLPLIGNLHQLGWESQASLAQLAHKYGPIMTLWLGSTRTVVISSSEAAREMFKYHDASLSGRIIYESMRGEHGNDGSIVTAHCGPQWRLMRRLCSSELFVSSRLDATESIRAKWIDNMLHYIKDASANNDAIDLGRFFPLMAFNLVSNLVFSKDLVDPKIEGESQFFYHANMLMELTCKPNVVDFFPFMRRFDPQGLKRKIWFHTEKASQVIESLRKERLQKCKENENCGEEQKRLKDFLDVLLDFRGDGEKEPSSFSPRAISTTILELFAAGTDTTSSTLEWAMSELLRHPCTLKKVQAEIRSYLGLNKRIEERDTEHLPYLKGVIKETLRLHPPAPLLIPHMAIECCQMLGYEIPKETQILVNLWAIGRDSRIWKDPSEFQPERFLKPNMVDYKGQHFELIPFGSGRRMCPGLSLASRVLPLALGSLLHTFDWILADGLKPQDLDMSGKMELTLRKFISLKAIPIPHNV